MKPSYRIYPSLLDKFQSYLDADRALEEPWNKVSESSLPMHPGCEVGDYIKTLDEIADGLQQELLDAINRVPHEPIEAADKGTCFNEILDCLIENRKPKREDLTVESLPDPYLVCQDYCSAKDCDYRLGDHGDGCTAAIDRAKAGKCPAKAIRATLNGFTFDFDVTLCREAAARLDGALPQHLCKGYIDTKYGTVELNGYSDYIQLDKIIDIKTTGQYSFGKFERAWQKDVYPYCLVSSGECKKVTSFEYSVYVLNKKPPFTGARYSEEYTYDHAAATERLRKMLEQFIGWLEEHREQITDTKIFGGDVRDKQPAA